MNPRHAPPAFPEALDGDDDDVAWALSTGGIEWRRGAHAEALVWLRRAIDAAREHRRLNRARDLEFRGRTLQVALEVGWVKTGTTSAPPASSPPRSAPPVNARASVPVDADAEPVEELEVDIDLDDDDAEPIDLDAAEAEGEVEDITLEQDIVEVEDVEAVETFDDDDIILLPSDPPTRSYPAPSRPASSRPASSRPASSRPVSSRPASSRPAPSPPAPSRPARSRLTSEAVMESAYGALDEEPTERDLDASPRFPPSEPTRSPQPSSAPPSEPAASYAQDPGFAALDSVPPTESVPPLPPESSPATYRDAPPSAPPPAARARSSAPPPSARARSSAPPPSARASGLSSAPPLSAPPLSTSTPSASAPPPVSAPPPRSAPPAVSVPPLPPPPLVSPQPRSAPPRHSEAPAAVPALPTVETASSLPAPSAPASAPAAPYSDSLQPEALASQRPETTDEAAPAVDSELLASVPGLEDLPEEAQAELARRAEVQTLGPDEEIGGFGLALVLEGSVAVMPTVADVAAAEVGPGQPVFAQGHLEDGVAVRVVAGPSGARVAVWPRTDLDAAVTDCPWVADELKTVGDRFQALAGVCMGPMGEYLDDTLRSMVVERCEVRLVLPGEVVAEKGKPVNGMYVLGGGHIEIVDDPSPTATPIERLGSGDFLFTSQILQASPAPAHARAGAGGALVLFAPRLVAHELMVSVPPLLEIFAR